MPISGGYLLNRYQATEGAGRTTLLTEVGCEFHTNPEREEWCSLMLVMLNLDVNGKVGWIGVSLIIFIIT
jgi:hypothetical protein